MKKLSFFILIFIIAITLIAQMPGAITIDPPDATAYDELTLIFDPDEACFLSGSLSGLPYIAMHSGVTIGGQQWQHVVEFDSTGANGQATTLLPTGDGRFSITYTPTDFYGLNGEIATHICAVFSNGTNWNQDGRDFDPDSTDFMDFFIPLNYGNELMVNFNVNMNYQIDQGNFDPVNDSVYVKIYGFDLFEVFDPDVDGIYSDTVENLEISTYHYIFLFNDTYETVGLRVIDVHEGYNEVSHWFNEETGKEIIDLDNSEEDVRILGAPGDYRAFERLATGDINGDGIDDIIIRSFSYNISNGIVYVIFGNATLPNTIDLDMADVTILGPNIPDGFGWGVESGDINGDNFDDILIGAPDADPGGREKAGKTYVIFGGNSLPSVIDLSSTMADLTVFGEDSYDNLGVRIASGDINNDGIDDLIVGAFQNGDLLKTGKVYIIYGSNTLPALIDLDIQPADVTILGEAGGDAFGISVWTGDINGDNIKDILVGANFADSPSGIDAGKAYVIYGDSSLPGTINLSNTQADVTILGNYSNSGFGFPLRSGDVNGDAIEDLVFSVWVAGGEMMVIFGDEALPGIIDLGSTSPDVHILGENDFDGLGGWPFAVSDVNNDLIDDIIAGALGADIPGRPGAGKSYIFFGSNFWPDVVDLCITPADITIWGDDAEDALGVSMASGDVNDDGINDIIVGAFHADPPAGSDAGEGYIIFGTATPTIIPEEGAIPKGFSLKQNYPNPFSDKTTIEYSLYNQDLVRLEILDIRGKKIKALVNEKQHAGKYQIEFDASELPSGIYFYSLNTSQGIETGKMILLR